MIFELNKLDQSVVYSRAPGLYTKFYIYLPSSEFFGIMMGNQSKIRPYRGFLLEFLHMLNSYKTRRKHKNMKGRFFLLSLA